VAVSLHLEGVIREGVYTMVGGPNYETVAELNLLRELGVDSVGRDKLKISSQKLRCQNVMSVFS
jgi:purine-nucleoside phosphorylase